MGVNYIRPSIELVDEVNGWHIMRKLESCAKTCYQSEGKTRKKSTAEFLKGIIKSGHTSVLEHESITVNIITNRGVLAELTRHRIGVGYSVESTRYVNYETGVNYILPLEYDFEGTGLVIDPALAKRRKIFEEACDTATYAYVQMIKNGAKPQEARAVLPQALKVNMKVTMNIRAWRHFFELRCAASAHPDIRELAIALLLYFRQKMLPLFEDIPYDQNFYFQYQKRIDAIVKAYDHEKEMERDYDWYSRDEASEKPEVNSRTDNSEKYRCNKDAHNVSKHNCQWCKDVMNAAKNAHEKKERETVDKMTTATNTNESGDDIRDTINKLIGKDRNPKVRVETYCIRNEEDVKRLMKRLFGEG